MTELLTIPEAAAKLRVHRDTVYQHIASGELPVVNVAVKGSKSRIDAADLQAFVAARKRAA